MKEANDKLKLARNQLLRGRTTTIVGASPMSEAVDAALDQLDILIKHFDVAGLVPTHTALRRIVRLLEAFQSRNDNVRTAYLDVIGAGLLVQGYEVVPGGEIIKRPRR